MSGENRPRPVIILFGPPGCGKGTQGALMAEHYQVPTISTGQILRAAVAGETELGHAAKGYMTAGKLVPDDLMLSLIQARLAETDVADGFILDGFPRTVAQAEGLDGVLGSRGFEVGAVLNIVVPRDELISRLTGRGREDDRPETVAHRLEVYEASTQPVLAFYQERGVVRNIDGLAPIETVFGRLQVAVDAEPAEKSNGV